MKEIDVIGLVKKVLSQKKTLLISIVVGAVVGVIIALSVPKVYKAEVLLAPEMSSGGLGLTESLADMASSFGLDMGTSGKGMDAIYPEIYPEVLSSYDFIQTLFDVPVRLKKDDNERTYFNHIVQDTKMPFWDYPKAWITQLFENKETTATNTSQKADKFKTPRLEYKIGEAISGNIGCLIDKKTSVILISVSDQDPLVAAIIADTLQHRLQNYITEYRTKKARNDYDYYVKLYKNAKAEYHKAQGVYASFCDANQDVMLESYIAKRDELENEMQTAFNLMSQMSTQMQAAKAKIQERTPAYTMIKSAKMPHKASSMSRAVMVLISIFVFVMIHSLWVLFLKDLFRKNK